MIPMAPVRPAGRHPRSFVPWRHLLAPTAERTGVRELAAEVALPLGSMGAILLAAGLVAVRGERWRPLVLIALYAPVAAAALFGGRWAAVVTALVAATSFRFFHLAPYGILEVGVREAAVVGVFLLPALLAPSSARGAPGRGRGRRRPARGDAGPPG